MLLTDKELARESRAILARPRLWTTLREQVAIWRLVMENRPMATVDQITRLTFEIYDGIVEEQQRNAKRDEAVLFR